MSDGNLTSSSFMTIFLVVNEWMSDRYFDSRVRLVVFHEAKPMYFYVQFQKRIAMQEVVLKWRFVLLRANGRPS